MNKLYGYIRISNKEKSLDDQKKSIDAYVFDLNNPTARYSVRENYSEVEYKDDKNIEAIIEKLNRDDILIIDSLDILGNSTYKILQAILIMQNKGIPLHSINENMILNHNTPFEKKLIVGLFDVEHSFISNRTQAAESTRKKNGNKLGRKKGSQFKSKYDKHKKEIKKLYEFGVSKTIIVKKIGIGTPQSLTTYINTKILKTKEKPKITTGFNGDMDTRFSSKNHTEPHTGNFVKVEDEHKDS